MAEASRRDVLRLGLGTILAGTAGLTGCTVSDPTVNAPSPSSTPSRSPSPSTGSPSVSPSTAPTITRAQRGSEIAYGLSDLAGAIRTGRQRSDLSARQKRLLAAVVSTHSTQAKVLSTYAPSHPPPSLAGSLKRSLRRLADQEQSAARQFRHNAVVTKGSDALTWASLALVSAHLATAVTSTRPPAFTATRRPGPVAVLSDTAATQEMVRQLHAVIYGYQLAIGKLGVLSKEHDRAVRELQEQRELRDRLIAWLIRRSADVPAAAAAYVPSVNPSSPAKAGQLIRRMNVALQPFAGLMIAAAADRDRAQAVTTLTAVVATARGWGAPLTAWPGF